MMSPLLWVVAGLGAASSEPCDREGEPVPPGLVPVPLRVEGHCWACGASAPALCLPVRRGDTASACTQSFIGAFSTVAPVSQEESARQ